MKNINLLQVKCILPCCFLLFASVLVAQNNRAMTLEDVISFQKMRTKEISYDGKWVAYAVLPDRGDGYGVLVSSDKKKEYKIERGEDPHFSYQGTWVLFMQKPPFLRTTGNSNEDIPKDASILINTFDGSKSVYANVKNASFSSLGNHLFIHHHDSEDDKSVKRQNKKLKNAGTPLFIKNLNANQEINIPFVDSWTVDSLSTMLVFSIIDTLDANNGLFYLPLEDLLTPPQAIEKTANVKYSGFKWYEKVSKLAYMRAESSGKGDSESATLHSWQRKQLIPELLLTQNNAPKGYFMPYDNNLTWSNDGQKLFFGLRSDKFIEKASDKWNFKSELDSIRQHAELDIWHWKDPFIKTHEKWLWERARRQNLISVYHIRDKKLVQLADEKTPNVQPSSNGNYAIAFALVPSIEYQFPHLIDLYVINLLTGERKLVVRELGWYRSEFGNLATISPKGDYIVYFKDDHWHAYHNPTGKHINITENIKVPFNDFGYDRTHPDRLRLGMNSEANNYISYHPSRSSGYSFTGWMEDEESVLICDQYDIWQANLRTTNARCITAGEGRKSQIIFRIRKLDNEAFFNYKEEVLIEGYNDKTKVRAIYSGRLDSQGITLIKDEEKKLRLKLISGDKKTILYTEESYNEFPDLWVSNKRFNHPVRLSNLNEQVERYNWGKSELISYRSADGVPLQGVVIKPEDYDSSKKYPVLVCFYEKYSYRLNDFDPPTVSDNPSFGLSPYFVSNGYVIFLPDIHYKEGRPGMSAVKSLVPGVQKLIDLGIADPLAIGLHGHSFSGYQAAYVITQVDIFNAVIAGAAVTNVTSSYGSIRTASGRTQQFLYETGQGRLNGTLYERRDLYIENSPLFYASEINTPLLLMHADTDNVVPWDQSIELYLTMRRAGKDVVYLQYRNEPHALKKIQNRIDYTIRMKEFLDYHLRGSTPADWIKDGIPYLGK